MGSPPADVQDSRTDLSRRIELAAVALTLLAGLGVVAGTIAWRHRSAQAAPVRSVGLSIAPDSPSKSLGDVAPERSATVAFTLRNLTSHPIRIQGAQTSCACSVVEGIPCTIDAGGTKEIRGVVQAGDSAGRLEGSFLLYTDDDREPEFRLGYEGRVVVPPR